MKVELKPDHDPTYLDEVNNFGGAKPDFAFNNLNEIHIHWKDVETDGKGNVLKMPLLTSKLCFGRIEYRIRHGHKNSRKPNPRYKAVPKCSRCPPSTVHSCDQLVAERIKSSPEITEAVLKWKAACNKAESDMDPHAYGKHYWERFTNDPFGYLWQGIRHSIVNHGRFSNSNDNAVKEQIEETARRKREKHAEDMRKRRKRERKERQKKNQPPPEFFVHAAWDECLKRTDQLKAARSVSGMSRQISTLNDQGCELTAYAWYYAELHGFRELEVKPGSMARWLIEVDLAPGQSYDNLKGRLKRDLARAREIDNGVYGDIWQRFDPDTYPESDATFLTLPDPRDLALLSL